MRVTDWSTSREALRQTEQWESESAVWQAGERAGTSLRRCLCLHYSDEFAILRCPVRCNGKRASTHADLKESVCIGSNARYEIGLLGACQLFLLPGQRVLNHGR